jgi:hypothetical protein
MGGDKYTSAKFYNPAYKNIQPPKSFIWIWNSYCYNKIKVFTWLFFLWIDSMSRISFEGRNTNRKEITITASCAFIIGKKPHYISFSYPFS